VCHFLCSLTAFDCREIKRSLTYLLTCFRVKYLRIVIVSRRVVVQLAGGVDRQTREESVLRMLNGCFNRYLTTCWRIYFIFVAGGRQCRDVRVRVCVCCSVKVSVSNGMSTTSSSLCPNIVVISPTTDSAPACRPTATIVNATKHDSPRTSLRCDAVTFTATSQLQVHQHYHRRRRRRRRCRHHHSRVRSCGSSGGGGGSSSSSSHRLTHI